MPSRSRKRHRPSRGRIDHKHVSNRPHKSRPSRLVSATFLVVGSALLALSSPGVPSLSMLTFYQGPNFQRMLSSDATSSDQSSSLSSSSILQLNSTHRSIVESLSSHLMEDVSRIWDYEPDDARPTMHTFFHPLDGNLNALSPEDVQVLAVWKHAWQQAGWNPRVLSLSDVQKRSDFDVLWSSIERLDLGSWSKQRESYERLCYVRYFAMAAVGGGYMSDYDTVPIHMPTEEYGELPNNGTFTSFSGGVPALLAGSAEQWEQTAQRLVAEGQKRAKNPDPDYPIFSDMMALFQLVSLKKVMAYNPVQVTDFNYKRQPGRRHIGAQLIPGYPRRINCYGLRKHRAIHLSHNTIREMKVDGITIRDRALLMAEVMDGYHTACGGPDFYATAVEEIGAAAHHHSTMQQEEGDQAIESSSSREVLTSREGEELVVTATN